MENCDETDHHLGSSSETGILPRTSLRDRPQGDPRRPETGGIDAVILNPDATKFEPSKATTMHGSAPIFRATATRSTASCHAAEFGDERAVADTLRLSGLTVPSSCMLRRREGQDDDQVPRDSFCGKMSACNNLRQYGIRYSLTSLHTMSPTAALFRSDLQRFAATCRIRPELKNARLGASARARRVQHVRYSEKLLERSGSPSRHSICRKCSAALAKMGTTMPRHGEDQRDHIIHAVKACRQRARSRWRSWGSHRPWVQQTSLRHFHPCWTRCRSFSACSCTLMSMMSSR